MKTKEERILERLEKFKKAREKKTSHPELTDLAYLNKEERRISLIVLGFTLPIIVRYEIPITTDIIDPLYLLLPLLVILIFGCYKAWRVSTLIKFMVERQYDSFSLQPKTSPAVIHKQPNKNRLKHLRIFHRQTSKNAQFHDKNLLQALREQGVGMFTVTFFISGDILRFAFKFSEGWFVGSEYVTAICIVAGYAFLFWYNTRYYRCADYMISQSAFDAEDLPFLKEESKA